MTQPHAPTRNRSAAKLNARLDKRLFLYGAAASAACAAALTTPAEAEIVYTPAHVVINPRHTFALDLNHDGITDFTVSNAVLLSTEIWGHTLRVLPASNNKVAGVKGIINTLYAYALNRGSEIGPKLDFVGKLMAASGVEYGYVGRWQNATNRYLGLMFHIDGEVHFGWARFTVSSGTGRIAAVLTGYAYETVANRPIVAGKTSGTDDRAEAREGGGITPAEPSLLGLLAGGSPALPRWR